MTKTFKLLASASAMATAALASAPAFALGTDANTSITNTVTLKYQVNSVQQTDKTAAVTFKVDRKIIITVAEGGTAGSTGVTPGQDDQAVAFTVLNDTNDTIDIKLTAANGALAHTGTDTFDVSNFRYYIDVNEDGLLTLTGNTPDTPIANGILDEVDEGDTVQVLVVADMPLENADATPAALVNGDMAGVRLTAQALQDDGDPFTNATTNDTDLTVVDTVFAISDGNGGYTDSHYANDDYEVVSAALTVNKYSRAVYDPITGTSEDAKMIPGARVEYCIAVENTGTISATDVRIVDSIPANTLYYAGSLYSDTDVTTTAGVTSCSDGTAVTDATGTTSTAGVVDAVDVTMATTFATNTKKGVRFTVTIQ